MNPADRASAYDRVARYVSLRTGLALPANRRPFIEAGIARAIVAARATSTDDYLDRLAASEHVFDDLIAEMTVGETYFFRDPDHFEFIRQEVLPDIRRRRGIAHVLRAWSAGCASGEEAYSLAILLGEERMDRTASILATDISRAVLAKARKGVYGEWSLRCPRPGLERHFSRQGNRFVLAEPIRRAVTFEYQNLAADDVAGCAGNAPAMDLVLCRNVLIYIEPERIPAIAQRLFASLAEGGWLITGPSDPLLSSHAPFDVALTPAGVFYRRAAPASPAIEAGERRTSAPPIAAPIESIAAIETDSPPAAPAADPSPPIDLPALGREAFAKGDYARVLHLLSAHGGDVASGELQVLSLANLGLAAEAERTAAAAAAGDPLTAERHLLHAITLMSLRRYEDAMAAARRAIYLRPDFPVAHLILGSVLQRIGAIEGARRAFRNSRALASAQPDHAVVACSGGEPASSFAAAASAQLALLDQLQAGTP
jgi:chemotaxis protein methyltransferase CheR